MKFASTSQSDAQPLLTGANAVPIRQSIFKRLEFPNSAPSVHQAALVPDPNLQV
jgi:hypothetical protein